MRSALLLIAATIAAAPAMGQAPGISATTILLGQSAAFTGPAA